MKFLSRTLLSARSNFLSDGVKCSFQGILDGALDKARNILRFFSKNNVEFDHGRIRYQYRLPFSFPIQNTQPTFARRPTTTYPFRPGFIQRVTSRWSSNSIVSALSTDAKRKLLRGGNTSMICFVGFALAKKPSLLTDEQQLEGVSYEIREAFSGIPLVKSDNGYHDEDNLSKQYKFEDLNIDGMIAKGCNAVVYSACFKDNEAKNLKPVDETLGDLRNDNFVPTQKVFMSHSEIEVNGKDLIDNDVTSSARDMPFPVGKLEPYNLAVKVMFNYSAESNAYAICRAMYKEMLPIANDFPFRDIIGGCNVGKRKGLPPHANTVQMYCGFADQLPLLPGAFANYPHALPSRLLSDGCGRNMTLFLVMKRYNCSLKDYLEAHTPTTSTSLLLFTQVLEALVHLLQNGVVHRDLKTDNILLDLTNGLSSPGLVLTDFGCCLETLSLSYPSNDIDKGGNMALMAPEVANAKPGPFSYIDYTRADLWTAGTIAYEIFGGSNPFYSRSSPQKASSQNLDELPPLPPKTPAVIQKLVTDMLHPDPSLRPSQSFAATVCQLLVHAPSNLLTGPHNSTTPRRVLDWMFLMSAETFLQASSNNAKLHSVEYQLRYTFCRRIQFMEVLEALRYILDA